MINSLKFQEGLTAAIPVTDDWQIRPRLSDQFANIITLQQWHIAQCPIDLLLLDMTECQPSELVVTRQAYPDLPIIALVESLEEPDCPALFDQGVIDVLSLDELYTPRLEFAVQRLFAGRGSNFMHAVLDAAPNMIYVKDRDGRYVFQNRAMREFFGANPAEMESKTHGGATNDMQTEQSMQSDLNSLLDSNGMQMEDERVFHNAQHEERILRCNNRSFSVFGSEPDFVLGLYTDITDLKSSVNFLTHEQFQLTRSNSEYSAMSSVAVKLMNRMESSELLQHISDELLELTHASGSFLMMVHESGEYMEVVASCGLFAQMFGYQCQQGESLAGLVWLTGEMKTAEKSQNQFEIFDYIPELRQVCCVPLNIDEEVVGVIGIAYTDKNSTHERSSLLKNFSSIASVAIENTRLIDATTKELARTAAISELGQTMQESTDLDIMFDNVCMTLLDVFDAKRVSTYFVDENSLLVPTVSRMKDADNNRPSILLPKTLVKESIAQWSLDNCECAVINRGIDDPRESSNMHAQRQEWQLGCTVCIPLVRDDRVWGIMMINRDNQQHDFRENDINLIKAIGSQISLAIHRQSLLRDIQYQAYHDSLTELPNRLKFESSLREITTALSPDTSLAAVMFIDLDGFKAVNDTVGHAVGDKLLKQVSRRLKNVLKSGDLLARMGGDEFAVLVNDLQHQDEATRIAQRLIDSLVDDFNIHGLKLKVGASVGVSYFPDNGKTVDDLLKSADIAMYQAKNEGKNQVHQFSPILATQYERRIQLESNLRKALELNEFELVYQPQVNSGTGTVEGIEALIRWNHPEYGTVAPMEFIPVAEECGFITEIGAWVLDEACRQTSHWRANGFPDLRISVNISALQFSQEDFVDSVYASIEKHNLESSCLELEVTESVVMSNVERVIGNLRELRKTDIKIAIDDFGTGYSSLSYLDNLPLDSLKIDRAFINKLDSSNSENSLANTIVLLARSFNLQTVAEGVETEEQLQKVIELGCDSIQGFYYSKPVSASDLPRTILNINNNTLDRKAG